MQYNNVFILCSIFITSLIIPKLMEDKRYESAL